MINEIYDIFISPFIEFHFIGNALLACWSLALGSSAVGVFLVLRRMSLLGDAISHSALPGVALGYAVSGMSLTAMSIGGFISGFFVAIVSMLIAKRTLLREDASLLGFYLIAMAIGIVIMSDNNSNIDLMHILLGNVLAIDCSALKLMASVATFSLIVLVIGYRALVIESFDPTFMRTTKGPGRITNLLFITLVVMNLVASIHSLGTLMALGLMMFPAIIARFWVQSIIKMYFCATLISITNSYIGIILSYYYDWPSGPSIILSLGVCYLLSILFGQSGGILNRTFAHDKK